MHLRAFLVFLASCYSLCLAIPTEVMRRPDNYLHETHHGPSKKPSTAKRVAEELDLDKRATAKVSIGYFTNWGIYARNFQPTDVIPTLLTHILYAFADVDPSSGTILLTDLYADEQKHFPTDSWNDVGNNLYGCLKQLYLLKMANRNLKVLLSIGGWTYSQDNHFDFVTNAAYRSTFVSSAVSMIENLGLDGVDIDFEYPANTDQQTGFASLLTELRTAFNTLATQKGDKTPYQITVAVSAGAANSAFLDVPTIDKAVTYWNLMAYDYAGSWSTVSDDMANLYDGQGYSNISTDAAVKSYIARGATASKITMGIPIYGRGFEDTTGWHQPYSGVGAGTWEAGVWDYKDLPMAGATVFENTTSVSSYSYDPVKMELISYDVPDVVSRKAQYVVANGMAGSMFWELSADKIGAASLVGTSKGVLGSLDQTQNHLDYPDSTIANIANNMAGSATGTTSAPVSSSTPPAGGSGGCINVAAWASTSVYTGGQEATYNGHLWTAKWWTQGDTPGGEAGVWTDDGAC